MASQAPTDTNPKKAVVCVFCASSAGINPSHLESARSLAHAFHAANISLVYGGGTSGIMGELARTLVALSGPRSVHGVIPRALIRTDPKYEAGSRQADQNGDAPATAQAGPVSGGKKAERTVSEGEMHKIDSGTEGGDESSEYGLTTVVADMHTRKRRMAGLVIEGGPGSGFVALAGGYGTIEEVMEMVTWNQLGIHHMPIVLVNIDGYWDGLLAWVRRAVEDGYVAQGSKGILVEVKGTEGVLDALRKYRLAEGRYKLDWSQW